jgi:signal transduction histidine kinase
VRGNPEKLQRVLFNLIQNAIRHTPADGSVTVRARPLGKAVEVEVADDGRGGRRRRNGGGHGLIGMRERVALYGGTLEAGRRASGGFRVHARLPIA